MTVYIDLVMLLNFGVDLLLLMAADRMAGYKTGFLRLCAAAALGSAYAGACLVPGFNFLQAILWRIVSLLAIITVAFGCCRSALRRGILFSFLSMALGGAVLGLNCGGFLSLLLCAGIILLMCMYGVGGKVAQKEYVKVELMYKGKRKTITALKDTGNSLIDPVTGRHVLVLGSDLAWEVLHLTEEQVRDPISTVATAQIPGLRLIPYSAVGTASGLLLAASLDEIRVGSQKVSNLVALSPNRIRSKEGYQALMGGVM